MFRVVSCATIGGPAWPLALADSQPLNRGDNAIRRPAPRKMVRPMRPKVSFRPATAFIRALSTSGSSAHGKGSSEQGVLRT
jgi:hypothetical protein